MAHYIITLKNCAFFAHHGVYNEEETLGQRFFVDAILEVDSGTSLDRDEIEGTVDYGAAFKVIERIVAGKRYFLIEALALAVARAICAEFAMVKNATISIRKPNAPVEGVLDHVEVTVSHAQE